jgi:serine/threonine protein kinase
VKYGAEVDMWSAGIVFVELMTKKSPFPGYNEPHQLDLIFKLLGTPDNSTWPGVEELPGYKKIRKGLYKQNQLRRVFKDWDVEAIDFLEQFFAPPSKRITAEQALQHHFFTTEPLPCDPSEYVIAFAVYH